MTTKREAELEIQVAKLREALEAVMADYELCGYPSSMKNGVAQLWRENMHRARAALRATKPKAKS